MFITSRESAIFPEPVPCLSARTLSAPGFPAHGLTLKHLPRPPCLSGGSRCPEHISALKNLGSKRISLFYWVLCLFSGSGRKADTGINLYVVLCVLLCTIRSSTCAGCVGSPAMR